MVTAIRPTGPSAIGTAFSSENPSSNSYRVGASMAVLRHPDVVSAYLGTE